MSDRELRDQLVTLLLAGHETTATALAWTFDLLLHAPAALARLPPSSSEGGERLPARGDRGVAAAAPGAAAGGAPPRLASFARTATRCRREPT